AEGGGRRAGGEWGGAPRVLTRLDANEDEMISRGEVMSFPGGFFDPGPDTRPGPAHGPAPSELPFFSVRPGEPVAPIVQALLARYDRNGDGKLAADEVKFDPALFA